MKISEKEKVVNVLREKFSEAKLTILTDFQGISVESMTQLRKQLREVGGEFKVVKNTMAKRALPGTQLEPIADHFQGSVAVIMGYDDPVTATKVIKEFADHEGHLKLKVGVFDGQVLDQNALREVAKLPSLDQLRAHLVQNLSGPIAGLVACLQQVLRKTVAVVNAIREKKEDQAKEAS